MRFSRLAPAGTCDGGVQAQQTTFLVRRRGSPVRMDNPSQNELSQSQHSASQPWVKVAVAQY